MIPYKDDNPTATTPFVTYILVAANIGLFFWMLPWHERAVWEYGLLPWELLTGQRHPDSLAISGHAALLTSMFMHGGFLHLGGNMLFLWVFGDNVEDAMGHVKFLIFYVLCGYAAHAFQLGWLLLRAGMPPEAPLPLAMLAHTRQFSPELMWFIPMVGASGAISGVMAAYYVLYPGARVRMIVPIFVFITTMAVPAAFVIGYWFLIQVISGLVDAGGGGGGVAWWAHIGGFIGGMLLLRPFLKRRVRAHLKMRGRWRRVRR